MDLERLLFKNGKQLIDPMDSWNIYKTEQKDKHLVIFLKDADDRICRYTLVPEDVVWNLCGKIYRLRNKQEVFDFYSAVQTILESRAIDEALE